MTLSHIYVYIRLYTMKMVYTHLHHKTQILCFIYLEQEIFLSKKKIKKNFVQTVRVRKYKYVRRFDSVVSSSLCK